MSDIEIKSTDLSSTDLSLLGLSSSGDRAVFDIFVRRHQASVYRFAQTLSDSQSQAEEVLQGTFIEAWRGASGFSGKGSAKSWLFTIARRFCGRVRRTRVGQPSSFEDIDTLGVNAGWGSDDGFADRIASREWIGKSLSKLKEADQEVLLLVELEGLTLEEAAGTIGQTKAATKSRLHRARLHLLTELRKENDSEG